MADYQKMYAVLCGAASEAIDQLESIPLALPVRRSLQAALDKVEEIYMEAPYPHACDDGGKVIEFKSDNNLSVHKCIFRLHPATCTVFFCHLAEQNPPPCRGCLPLHRWCKGSARSLRSGKALASKVQLVNQSS